MDKIEILKADDFDTRLKSSLEDRFLPDYFLYLGCSGVDNWLSLYRSSEFTIAARLTSLLKGNIEKISRHFSGELDVVSIGVGGGEKEKSLLEELTRCCQPRYFAVDASSEMVDVALEAVSKMKIESTGIVALLEDLYLIHDYWNSNVLVCLLGNTLCNYEPDEVFRTVHLELEENDYFMFDCSLLPFSEVDGTPDIQSVIDSYRTGLNVTFNLNPLLCRGLCEDDCEFHLDVVRVEDKGGTAYRTAKWIEILKGSKVECGCDSIELPAGSIINMGFTYKFTPEQVARHLEVSGFEALEIFFSPEKTEMMVLARKVMEKET
ncbi:MAG: L-histidine N(alpha)-methyltransferase [Actinobacteria bacterium]|nr:L-histidine N(alpha)-methyltransferase [Actinomycetota bacterium]